MSSVDSKGNGLWQQLDSPTTSTVTTRSTGLNKTLNGISSTQDWYTTTGHDLMFGPPSTSYSLTSALNL